MSKLVSAEGSSSTDGAVRVRPSMRFAIGLLTFDGRGRKSCRLVPFGGKSNNSDRVSTLRFEVVGVDVWSIGCVDVRLSGVAERGVRGDNTGSEAADLTGVRMVCVAGDLDDGALVSGPDGEDGRVGVLDSPSKGG